MSQARGRPRTGVTPQTSIRLNPEAHRQARIAAVTAKKTLGKWLEEAIWEKLERDKQEGNNG